MAKVLTSIDDQSGVQLPYAEADPAAAAILTTAAADATAKADAAQAASLPNVAPGADGNVLTSNGTVWVSETPAGGGASYLVYTARVLQSGAADPDVTILENTLGRTIVWTYESPGELWGTPSSGTFPADKTFLIIDPPAEVSIVNGSVFYFYAHNFVTKVEIIKIIPLDGASDDPDLACTFELRQYP